MSTHLHLYFAAWQNESRAWRAGTAALEAGLANEVLYLGHKVKGLADRESIAPVQTVLRVGARPTQPGSPRLLRAMALPRWWRACAQAAARTDISMVVAHSLAALPVAVWISKRHNAPLLYDAHELETERHGWSATVRALAKVVERLLIRSSNHTIVVNDSIRGWYEAAYPGLSVSTVRNVPSIPTTRGESGLRKTLGIPAEAIVFIYCGVLGEGRGLLELVEAFDRVGPDRRLVLVGQGPLAATLRARTAGSTNIHVLDAVPQDELLTLLSGADVGVMVPSSEALSYRYCLPNKIFEYASASLAICVGRGPELQRFAASYPASRTSEPDPDALRAMALSWTREELNERRPLIAAFTPPTWEEERSHLLDAYRQAVRHTSRASQTGRTSAR